MIAALVLLGQVDFELDEFQKSKPTDSVIIASIAEFLCLKPEQVNRFLCYRVESGTLSGLFISHYYIYTFNTFIYFLSRLLVFVLFLVQILVGEEFCYHVSQA